MDFRLDEGQVELQDTIRRFCATRFPLDTVADREGKPTDRVLWEELGALGVFGLLLPEADGGSGLGEQFGAPIGSFQAVKHILADMYVRTGLARSATYAAAAVLDDPAIGDAARTAGAAKLLAGEAAVDNARAAVQVLGGMGFTWAMLPHYLLKRAWVLEHAFGTADAHALAIGSSLGDEVS